MSFLVCDDERQNRTRELMSGVALMQCQQDRSSLQSSDNGDSRVGNDDDDDWGLVGSHARLHHLREIVHFGRVEDEERNDGRVAMTIHHEPEFAQSRSEVPRVERKAT